VPRCRAGPQPRRHRSPGRSADRPDRRRRPRADARPYPLTAPEVRPATICFLEDDHERHQRDGDHDRRRADRPERDLELLATREVGDRRRHRARLVELVNVIASRELVQDEEGREQPGGHESRCRERQHDLAECLEVTRPVEPGNSSQTTPRRPKGRLDAGRGVRGSALTTAWRRLPRSAGPGLCAGPRRALRRASRRTRGGRRACGSSRARSRRGRPRPPTCRQRSRCPF
jgi:hypothetical protein